MRALVAWIPAEDRLFLANVVVWTAAFFYVVSMIALGAGLAIRVFQMAAG